jgi:hypothetical protein
VVIQDSLRGQESHVGLTSGYQENEPEKFQRPTQSDKHNAFHSHPRECMNAISIIMSVYQLASNCVSLKDGYLVNGYMVDSAETHKTQLQKFKR